MYSVYVVIYSGIYSSVQLYLVDQRGKKKIATGCTCESGVVCMYAYHTKKYSIYIFICVLYIHKITQLIPFKRVSFSPHVYCKYMRSMCAYMHVCSQNVPHASAKSHGIRAIIFFMYVHVIIHCTSHTYLKYIQIMQKPTCCCNWNIWTS